MKPDLLLQWCVYADYPLYRAWAAKYRNKFNKIIIYPSRQHGVVDLEEFAKRVFPETWVERENIDYGVTDWRQGETEPLLKHVESDWIYFSEQDFFCKNWDKFFEDIERESKTSDMMGLWNPTHFPYVHPSCLLIKTEVFNMTNKDFRAHPEINGADHFSMITRDVIDRGGLRIRTLQNMGYDADMHPDADCFHLGGLTYVYQDFKGKDTVFGVKSPEAFMTYNYQIRQLDIEQNPEFLGLSQDIENILLDKLNMSPRDNEWTKFFTI